MAKASSPLPAQPISSDPPFTFLNIDEAAASLLAIINGSPRRPTLEQIRTVLELGHLPSDADEPATVETMARLDFEPLDLEFEGSNEEFAQTYLPIVRIGFKLLQRDAAGTEQFVRELLDDGGEKLLLSILENTDVCARKLAVLGGLLATAHNRLLIAMSRQSNGRAEGRVP
jgi:hypothetical protein